MSCHPQQIMVFIFNDKCTSCVWLFIWGYIILYYIFLACPCISITERKLQVLNPSQFRESRTFCPIGLCLSLPGDGSARLNSHLVVHALRGSSFQSALSDRKWVASFFPVCHFEWEWMGFQSTRRKGGITACVYSASGRY